MDNTALRMRKLFGQAVSWYRSASLVFSRTHYLAGVYEIVHKVERTLFTIMMSDVLYLRSVETQI